jgi:hypothetical protein
MVKRHPEAAPCWPLFAKEQPIEFVFRIQAFSLTEKKRNNYTELYYTEGDNSRLSLKKKLRLGLFFCMVMMVLDVVPKRSE